ncbi:hypothetical protein ACFL6Y_06520 [Elusimicrobiota bacterium]
MDTALSEKPGPIILDNVVKTYELKASAYPVKPFDAVRLAHKAAALLKKQREFLQ